MTIEEIRKNAPKGATHYSDSIEGIILYFFESSYGFRQIKGNIINFYDSGVEYIKPLY